MPKPNRRSWTLAAAFGGVVLSFVASTLLVDWRTLAIDRETEALLGNSLPSFKTLGDVNDAARDVEAALDELFEAPVEGRPTIQARIDADWRRIDASLAAYAELPMFPGEPAVFAEIPAALRDFDAAVRVAVTAVEEGREGQARVDADGVVRRRANRVTHLLRQVILLNATEAASSATRIDQNRRSSIALSIALDVIAAALTIGTALWVARLVRSHEALLEARTAAESTKVRELEVFGQRVAHDLLAPLSALTFNLGSFKKASVLDTKLEGALARSRQCVHRAQQLVDNLFDFARSGGAPDPSARSEVREAVEEVVAEARALAEAERVEIVVGQVPASTVRCSRGVLSSILGNLLRNALKYMGDSVERRVTIRVTELDHAVRFQVSDTGPGIPPAIETTLFEPYVRGDGATKTGLGLGLSTVKRFCEAYGGGVTVRSAVGRGSVFQVVLPVASGASRTVDPPSLRALLDDGVR
jgi:signal transduction histidine kinase